jgi:hypothetical protein
VSAASSVEPEPVGERAEEQRAAVAERVEHRLVQGVRVSSWSGGVSTAGAVRVRQRHPAVAAGDRAEPAQTTAAGAQRVE